MVERKQCGLVRKDGGSSSRGAIGDFCGMSGEEMEDFNAAVAGKVSDLRSHFKKHRKAARDATEGYLSGIDCYSKNKLRKISASADEVAAGGSTGHHEAVGGATRVAASDASAVASAGG